MANSVDPVQRTRSVAPGLGLHFLVRSVCPNALSEFSNQIQSNLCAASICGNEKDLFLY